MGIYGIPNTEKIMLDDHIIQGLKAADKPKKYADGGGLFLFIPTSGKKLWRLAYRFERKAKLLSFGEYPQVSLRAARQRRDEAKALLRDGVDPAKHRKAARASASNATFQSVAMEWFERELQCFPYSAFYSGLRLEIMRRSGSPPETILSAAEHYELCMRLRGLKPGDFARLLAAPGLDDQPLVQFSRQDTGS